MCCVFITRCPRVGSKSPLPPRVKQTKTLRPFNVTSFFSWLATHFTWSPWTHQSRGVLWKVFRKPTNRNCQDLTGKTSRGSSLHRLWDFVCARGDQHAEQRVRGLAGRRRFWFTQFCKTASNYFALPELGEWLHGNVSMKLAEWTDVSRRGWHESSLNAAPRPRERTWSGREAEKLNKVK